MPVDEAQYGDQQVLIWRRSYDTPPDALRADDARASFTDPRYAHLKREEIPLAECLKDTVARVLPFWNGLRVAHSASPNRRPRLGTALAA